MGLFEKQGFVVTPAACGYESQHTPAQAWAQSTPFDFLPTAKALLITTQALDEVAGAAGANGREIVFQEFRQRVPEYETGSKVDFMHNHSVPRAVMSMPVTIPGRGV